MKTFFWGIVAIVAISAMIITVTHPDWIVDPTFPKAYALSSDKCTDARCLPNPNRNQFDLWGNEFDYQGNLLTVGTCPYTDPISGKPNPYCAATQPTGCPWADAAPLGLECDKLAPQQQDNTVPVDQNFEGK